MTSTSRDETLIRVLLLVAIFAVVAGCSEAESSRSTSTSTNPTATYVRPAVTPAPDAASSPTFSVGLTYGNISGNKYYSGTGNHDSNTPPVRIESAIEQGRWVIGSPHPRDGIAWIHIGEGGNAQGLVMSPNGERDSIGTIYGSRSDNLVPPMLLIGGLPESENDDGAVRIEDVHAAGRSHLVEGVQFEEFDDKTSITFEGLSALYSFATLPDSIPVIGNGLNMYSYSEPTERYPHGALGDRSEWASLITIPLDGDDRTMQRYDLPEDEVFEGIYPLLADIDGDGEEEIVTTVSNLGTGARLVVFKHNSQGLRIIAESDPVGSGFRWLHQIAAAPFGPNGEIEIAVVQTPHIGGIAKYYRLAGNRLELVASSAGGYMSHVNGSRNLDQAVAGDFDGDGHVELLVPSRDQQTLIALRRIGDSVEEVWNIDLGARLMTNLSVVVTPDGDLVLGYVTKDGPLQIRQ